MSIETAVESAAQEVKPNGLVDWHVDLFYDDQWNEITDDVLVTDTLHIRRGRSDYQSDIPPSECSFVLDNTDGKYSPKNPYSPLYGKLGRNQPVQVRAGAPEVAATFDNRGTGLYTAGDESTNLTSEFYAVVDIEPETWFPQSEQLIAQSRQDGTSWIQWMLILRPDGAIRLLYYTSELLNEWVELAYEDFGVQWDSRMVFHVQFWYDTANSRQTIGIWPYRSFDLSDPTEGRIWWNLSSDTMHDGGQIELGHRYDGDNLYGMDGFRGRIFGFRMGSVGDADDTVRMVVPSTANESFVDDTGYTWHVGDNVGIVDQSLRFSGDVLAWPPRWGQPDGADAHVPIVAYGVRKRLGRTTEPLKSAFRRMSSNAGPASRTLAYWPMEDPEGSLYFASAIGSDPMLFGNVPGYHIRDIELAADSDFVASDPLPKFSITVGTGRVDRVESTGEYRLFALVKFPDDGIPTDGLNTDGVADVLTLHMTGTISEWAVQVSHQGWLRIKRVRASDGAIGYTDWLGPPSTWESPEEHEYFNGRQLVVGMWLRTNGADVDYQLTGWWTESYTISASDHVRADTVLGIPTNVTVGNYGDLGGTTVGHVTLWNRDTNEQATVWESIPHALRGNMPDTATERAARVFREEGLPALIAHSPIDAEALGVQGTNTAFGVVEEAAAVDLAVFCDSRDSRTMYYRPRGSLYNQAPVVLDYEAGHVVAPFEPTDDDENLANDVTVQRSGGSSYRVVQEIGPLSVADPPAGVGRYDESTTLNVASDAQLANQAGWRLHMGTIDDVRYPVLTVSLNGSPDLAEKLLPVDIGDRIQVLNLPKWVPPGNADLIVQGYTEESNGVQWTLAFNCTPAAPWSVGVADDPVYGRADTAGSQLLYGVDDDTQTLPVLTTNGPRWVQADDGGQFPFDVSLGGETVTVQRIIPLLSDLFARDDAGLWDDPQRGVWGDTFVWSP